MKCMSSCFSCLCGTKSSARVTPSDPIQIVQANAVKHPSRYRRTTGEDDNDGSRINPNFTIGDGEDDPASSLSDENSAVKALYIEVGKDRLLRVIHIRSSEQEDVELSTCRKGSVHDDSTTASPLESKTSTFSGEQGNAPESNSKLPPVVNNGDGAGGDEDEEEYWFSKWARKPRFRSIFAKNPENRPKLGGSGGESNNNVSPNESNKVSVELEMARAAAAAKRRAWAYNNNGNCEPTILQQPTVNLGDEEEFNSIAIVNAAKQQWTKQSGSTENSSEKGEDQLEAGASSPFQVSSSQVQVEVSVEKHNEKSSSPSPSKEGISNPAFQDDDDVFEGRKEHDKCESNDKTEHTNQDKPFSALNPKTSSVSSSSSNSTNGNKTTTQVSLSNRSSPTNSNSSSSTRALEDEITTEEPQDHQSRQSNISPASSSNTATPTLMSVDSVHDVMPRKPILFFIHSVAGSSDMWHHQFEFFQQLGYEIVAPDLLGHGLSSTPLNPKYYYFESLVQDLILIFDHFCKDEDAKVVLIGHGYGACLAAMLTRVRLKNVALLISIAGGGPTPLVRRTCCQDSWFSWKCKLFHSNRIRGRFDNPELKHVLPATIHRNLLSGQVWPDGDSAFYRRITVPTLLTYGMRDKVVTLVEECEMERTIPKSFLELIDSAGHMVMLDEPDKLNKMLCKFIQSWS